MAIFNLRKVNCLALIDACLKDSCEMTRRMVEAGYVLWLDYDQFDGKDRSGAAEWAGLPYRYFLKKTTNSRR